LETGVSIPDTIIFDSVWGYCGGNNAINNFIQSLCRVRYNCDRFLFINDHGLSDDDRGIGVSYREKIYNLGKKNDNIRKILKKF
jgi:hypothetical protein